MNTENPSLDAALENLADISVGNTPSVWPLAWGWWVLIVLGIVLVISIIWLVSSYIRKHKFKRGALHAVEGISPNQEQALSTLHTILRSAIIYYFPAHGVHGLQGNAWQQFLQEKAKQRKKVDAHCLAQLALLEASVYSKVPRIDVNDAKQAVSLWIKQCLPPGSSALLAAEKTTTDTKGVQHV